MFAAESLAKRDVFRLPDPFAVITVDGEQTLTTSVIKVGARSLQSARRADGGHAEIAESVLV